MTNDDDRVDRRSYPTAAFTLKKSQIAWIARAAKDAGVSKSAYVRLLLDRAMEREDRAA